jgi:hypothetical protein
VAFHFRRNAIPPPDAAARLNTFNPSTAGLVWLSGAATYRSGGGTATLADLARGQIAQNYDNNNYPEPTPTPVGVVLTPTGPSSYFTLSGPTALLHGATALSMLVAFVFRSATASQQCLNFRVSNQHTIDTFSQTTSSITWGTDWAGAWNGANQQTLSGLSDGDLVVICSSISQTGARLFAQGRLLGTKSGSSFTISTASAAVGITGIANTTSGGARNPLALSAAWARTLSDEEAQSLTANPWQLFAPRRIWVPQAAITGAPTLSTAEIAAYTSTTARPRVTLTF